MEILIRPARLEELQELQTLFVDTIKHSCSKDYNSDQINAWISSAKNKERWTQSLQNQYFIVAELNKKLVGFASLENGKYLDFFYVHKDFQRMGIATQLISQIKHKSETMGVDTLSSDVSITARSFFESKGFRVVKQNRIYRNGVELVNYCMRKDVKRK